MSAHQRSGLKFGVFAIVMALLTASLFVIFGQYRSGATRAYSAVFRDVSGLRVGDSVRAAGMRVGTVKNLAVQPDNTVVATLDADREVALTRGGKDGGRFLNPAGAR